MAAIPLKREIEYPETDDRPMAESDLHRDVMLDLIHALRSRYAGEPKVYVAGNLLLYYVEGNPRASIAPDVFMVRGVPKGRRRTYLLWKEGRAPSFVIEVTSESTCAEDLGKKKDCYERLGVEEYFLFDPAGEYLRPRLQGYRLAAGRYQSLAEGADGSLSSRTTGLVLRPEGTNLRLVDAATGERLLWVEEETAARRAAEERAQTLEKELEQLRRETGRA
jgi:Uma2 family endonuclease